MDLLPRVAELEREVEVLKTAVAKLTGCFYNGHTYERHYESDISGRYGYKCTKCEDIKIESGW